MNIYRSETITTVEVEWQSEINALETNINYQYV